MLSGSPTSRSHDVSCGRKQQLSEGFEVLPTEPPGRVAGCNMRVNGWDALTRAHLSPSFPLYLMIEPHYTLYLLLFFSSVHLLSFAAAVIKVLASLVLCVYTAVHFEERVL